MSTMLKTMLAAAVLATAAQSGIAATPLTAAEVSIGGIGPGVDARAFNRVKLLISDALYRGTIDYFDVYGYGKEGGFSACFEKGRFAAAGSFETLIRGLNAIKPNPRTTAYSVTPVDACDYPEPAPTPLP